MNDTKVKLPIVKREKVINTSRNQMTTKQNRVATQQPTQTSIQNKVQMFSMLSANAPPPTPISQQACSGVERRVICGSRIKILKRTPRCQSPAALPKMLRHRQILHHTRRLPPSKSTLPRSTQPPGHPAT